MPQYAYAVVIVDGKRKVIKTKGFSDANPLLANGKVMLAKSELEKDLKAAGIKYTYIGISEHPPTTAELEKVSKAATTKNPASKSKTPSGKTLSGTYIKSWYLKKYPDDREGQRLNYKATFDGALKTLKHAKTSSDFYDYIFINSYVDNSDPTVRERIFNELAKRTNLSYDTIYQMWLGVPMNTNRRTTRSKMPNISTAKNPLGGKIDIKDNPYKHNYVAELKNARLFYKDAVIVVTYNQARLWGSREAAKDFYMDAFYSSDGAERERYMNICFNLDDGKDVAFDD